MRRNGHVVAVHVCEVFVSVLHTRHLVSLEHHGSGLTKHLLVDDALEAVVEHTHFVALTEWIFAQQATCGSLQALLANDLATQQRQPAGRAVTVTVRVAIGHVDQLLQHVVAHQVQTTQQDIGRHAVDGKDIDVESAKVRQVCTLDERGAGVLHLAEGQRIGGVRLVAHKLVWLFKPLVGIGNEGLVVLTRHRNIKVVVPGNKTLVTHGTQHRTVVNIIM